MRKIGQSIEGELTYVFFDPVLATPSVHYPLLPNNRTLVYRWHTDRQNQAMNLHTSHRRLLSKRSSHMQDSDASWPSVTLRLIQFIAHHLREHSRCFIRFEVHPVHRLGNTESQLRLPQIVHSDQLFSTWLARHPRDMPSIYTKTPASIISLFGCPSLLHTYSN